MIRPRRSIHFFASLLALAALLTGAATAQAQTPQQTLNQYVSDLQKNPGDIALREKIIRHVQAMKPAPAIPEEARRFMNRGMAAAEGAKTESDYKDAMQEFQKAVNSAPWLGSAYRNLAVVQDKAGQHAQAIQNLRLYLLTTPLAADAEAAKTLLDKIEYRQEKAAKESSPEAIAANKQKDYEAWLKKLDGAQWRNDLVDTTSCTENYIEMHGREIRTGWITVRPGAPSCHLNPRMGDGWTIYRGNVEGRNFVFRADIGTNHGTISEDGEVIMVDFTPSASAAPIFKPQKSSYTRVKNPRWTIWNR
jgi:tetratricopeptide (TPR) repeat protein